MSRFFTALRKVGGDVRRIRRERAHLSVFGPRGKAPPLDAVVRFRAVRNRVLEDSVQVLDVLAGQPVRALRGPNDLGLPLHTGQTAVGPILCLIAVLIDPCRVNSG